jgi:hypothetical protein
MELIPATALRSVITALTAVREESTTAYSVSLSCAFLIIRLADDSPSHHELLMLL